jgi:DNA-binding NtrC family response regulator
VNSRELDEQTLVDRGLVASALGDSATPRNVVCTVLEGSKAGATVELSHQPRTIGAGQGCALVVEDPLVSRKHAELTWTAEGVALRDLGSTNGTFVGSTRVEQVTLALGSIFRLGHTRVRISARLPACLPPSPNEHFGELVGVSPAIRETFALLELAAPTEATVLLQGESGTGKDLAAHALHQHSQRRNGPFVVVDCGAIPETLVDSHLFGHVRGAFTGANSERRGAFVEASAGTLFLDEIGELAPQSQARLLRVLETRTVQPVGSDATRRIDVRVIAATHRDLWQMVQQRQFRFDLYHRLVVVHVLMPALRDRAEDLPVLIRSFFEQRGLEPGQLDCENLQQLERWDWPGNVRELRNVLERALVLAGAEPVPFAELPLWFHGRVDRAPPQASPVDTSLPFKEAKERAMAAFEREYLAALFAQNEGNISQTARQADLTRRHARELLRRHGLLE